MIEKSLNNLKGHNVVDLSIFELFIFLIIDAVSKQNLLNKKIACFFIILNLLAQNSEGLLFRTIHQLCFH